MWNRQKNQKSNIGTSFLFAFLTVVADEWSNINSNKNQIIKEENSTRKRKLQNRLATQHSTEQEHKVWCKWNVIKEICKIVSRTCFGHYADTHTHREGERKRAERLCETNNKKPFQWKSVWENGEVREKLGPITGVTNRYLKLLQ